MSTQHTVTLLMSEFVTHDVRRLLISRPAGFEFVPGQGVELSIDHPEWRDKARPFTPTSLRNDQILELTIKRYPEHEGVTRELPTLEPGIMACTDLRTRRIGPC
jgi:ferredoxin-NADP reductase